MQNNLVALPKPLNEGARLKTLAAYDTIVDPSFDRLVALAARVLETPVALVSLVGRDTQFFIAKVGIELCETGREVSFCVHALGGHEALIVRDTTQDPRFEFNPLVVGEPHIRFYAGAPLVGFSGDVIGTLCVMDFKARPEFSNAQTETLRDIAALVMQQMELHRLRRIEQAAHQAQNALRTSEQQFRLLVGSVTDYALYMLSPTGMITSWNEGAQRIKGYMADEVIGEHLSIFCTNEQRMLGEPTRSLSTAVEQGRFEEDAWRVRKDGSLFWANIVVVPIYGGAGELIGFAKVTRDISERRNSEERLYRLAHFDSLTQLPNRFSMHSKLEEFLESNPAVTVLMLDLDEFKDVNDTLGHAAGDFLLKEAGSRIQACVADRGIVGRLGGDEFAVILPGLADPLAVSETCRQLIAAFRAPFRWEEEEVYVVPCIGIAMSPSHGATPGIFSPMPISRCTTRNHRRSAASACSSRPCANQRSPAGRAKANCVTLSRKANWNCFTSRRLGSPTVALWEPRRCCGGATLSAACWRPEHFSVSSTAVRSRRRSETGRSARRAVKPRRCAAWGSPASVSPSICSVRNFAPDAWSRPSRRRWTRTVFRRTRSNWKLPRISSGSTTKPS